MLYHIFISNNVNFSQATAISAHAQISGQKSDNAISSLSINRSMHDFFHNRTVIIPQPKSTNHIHISLAKALWLISLSRDDNSPDMEKGMHIYKYS